MALDPEPDLAVGLRNRGDQRQLEAREILSAYWGATGVDRTLRAADLRKLKLSDEQATELADALPPRGAGGATGQRVDECYRVLETLV